jgi:hypothetical protein
MYPGLTVEGSQPSAAQKKLDDQNMIANPRIANDGFNIWWQKTIAQNMAMVAETSDLMHAHGLVSSAHKPRTRRAR